MWHPMWKDSTWSVWYTQGKSVRCLKNKVTVRFWPLKAIFLLYFHSNTIVGQIWAFFSSFSRFCLFKFFSLLFLVPLFFPSIYSSFFCVWFYCIFVSSFFLCGSIVFLLVWFCWSSQWRFDVATVEYMLN